MFADLPLEKADIVLHFGWGLGYSGVHLSERLKADGRVFVLEPDTEVVDLLRADRQHREVLEDSRFQFLVERRLSQFIDDWGLEGCQDADRILWIGWPREEQLHGDLSSEVQAAFNIRLRDRAGKLLTHYPLTSPNWQ